MDIRHNIVDIIDVFNKNGVLSVPKYQRGYAWDEENFSEMWEDIKEIIIAKNEMHFFGSIILASKDDNNRVEVIDGQQRLTTFTIFFRVLHDLCPSENGVKRQIYKKIISSDEGNTYKLTLGQADEKFFEKYIKRPTHDRTRPGKFKSHKLIRKCYEFFDEEIKKYCEENEVTLNEFVNDIFEKLESKTQLLQIAVPTDADAYTIFESINAKRVDLTPAELLKNYIFSLADGDSQTKLAEVEGYWDSVMDNLSQFDKEPDLTEYVRHYWVSSQGDIQQKKLYKEIRNKYKRNASKTTELIKNLAAESYDYAALYNSGIANSSKGVKLDASSSLAKLNYKQAYPVILAILASDIDQDEYDAIAHELTSLVIRRSIVGSNPNELEKVFGQAARVIRANYDKGMESLRAEIKKLKPKSLLVHTAIIEGSDCPNSRFILEKYEESLSSVGGKKIDKPTLEHIMPQVPENLRDWGVSSEEHIFWVNNIGNLTLLEKPINSSVRNKGFSLKASAYREQRTDMNMTKDLALKNTKWSIENINKRADEIAKFVTSRW